ncbi:MAG: hypothetical protein ACXWUH_12675 [Burkholderiales bacterium]
MPTDSYTESSTTSNSISDIGSAASTYATFRAFSEHDRSAIGAIIESKHRIALAQAQAREDVKALAERLGMKPSELNRIVGLAIRERERGNVLAHEKALIEAAEQVVG